MKTIAISYKSTRYYLIDTGDGLLAFDAGWPGTYREYRDHLKSEGYRTNQITWLVVSHFHIDHAGLAGAMVENGVQFFVFRNQLDAIAEMEALIERKHMQYQLLDRNKIIVSEIAKSRDLLKSIGIRGQILHTNGHSEDSISLLLDSGEAFIGDLPPEGMIAETDHNSKNNWQLLKSMGAKHIRPAHAHDFMITPD